MAKRKNELHFYSQEQEGALLELRTLKPSKRREAIAQLAKSWKKSPIALNAKYFKLKGILKKAGTKLRATTSFRTPAEKLISPLIRPELFFPFTHYNIEINERGVTTRLK